MLIGALAVIKWKPNILQLQSFHVGVRNFNPFPVLKSERLTLRQLANGDDNEIFSLRSNGNVNKYLGRKPSETIDEARTFIQMINENIQRNESLYWAIIFNDTGKLVGTICLFGFSDEDQKAEIGYELLPEFQGKGIMQEAISKVIQFGFQHAGLNSIEAYTHSENHGSTRLLEKVNFKKDSAVEDNFLVYRLTRDGKRSG